MVLTVARRELPAQRPPRFIIPAQIRVAPQTFVSLFAAAGFFLSNLSGPAQGVQHLSITEPGGMPGLPVMTGIQLATNGVVLTWDGPSGYYHLYQKSQLPERELATVWAIST